MKKTIFQFVSIVVVLFVAGKVLAKKPIVENSHGFGFDYPDGSFTKLPDGYFDYDYGFGGLLKQSAEYPSIPAWGILY